MRLFEGGDYSKFFPSKGIISDVIGLVCGLELSFSPTPLNLKLKNRTAGRKVDEEKVPV